MENVINQGEPIEAGVIERGVYAGNSFDEFTDVYERQSSAMSDQVSVRAKRYELLLQTEAQAITAKEKESDLTYADMALHVTRRANALVRYEDDEVNYDEGDYYAAPVETLERKSGDCEDYAILKYFMLRDMGVPVNRLMLAGVTSETTKGGPDHCVLLMNVGKDNSHASWVVLDNDRSAENHGGLYPLKASGYKVFELMNEEGAWLTDAGQWTNTKIHLLKGFHFYCVASVSLFALGRIRRRWEAGKSEEQPEKASKTMVDRQRILEEVARKMAENKKQAVKPAPVDVQAVDQKEKRKKILEEVARKMAKQKNAARTPVGP